jgi:hypothetical protein
MKKGFVLLFGLVLTISVMAQNVSGNLKVTKLDENICQENVNSPIDLHNAALFAPGDHHAEWLNFGYFLCDATTSNPADNYIVHPALLFPDTFVMVRYIDAIKGGFVYDNINWCSVGSVLDPVSDIFLNGSVDVKKNAAYTVDSIEIPYWYDRFSDPSVVDTLVIQMYKPANLSNYTYKTGVNAGKKAFAVPIYNRSTKEGAMADWVKRIPLTSTDTITTHMGYIREAVTGFNIPNGGAVGITWTFKSGNLPINYLDTIPLAKWDSVQGVSHPHNAFYWSYYLDRTQEPLYEYNNGVIINSQQRYSDLIFSGDTKTIFPSTYLSFSMWLNTDPAHISYALYPNVSMHLSWIETVGINDLARDVKVMIYPTPALRTQNANLDMTLTSKKNITIDVYDLLGHKVSSVTSGTYNAGKYNFSINTSSLDAGMYICNIVADGAVKTIKFEVR